MIDRKFHGLLLPALAEDGGTDATSVDRHPALFLAAVRVNDDPAAKRAPGVRFLNSIIAL